MRNQMLIPFLFLFFFFCTRKVFFSSWTSLGVSLCLVCWNVSSLCLDVGKSILFWPVLLFTTFSLSLYDMFLRNLWLCLSCYQSSRTCHDPVPQPSTPWCCAHFPPYFGPFLIPCKHFSLPFSHFVIFSWQTQTLIKLNYQHTLPLNPNSWTLLERKNTPAVTILNKNSLGQNSNGHAISIPTTLPWCIATPFSETTPHLTAALPLHQLVTSAPTWLRTPTQATGELPTNQPEAIPMLPPLSFPASTARPREFLLPCCYCVSLFFPRHFPCGHGRGELLFPSPLAPLLAALRKLQLPVSALLILWSPAVISSSYLKCHIFETEPLLLTLHELLILLDFSILWNGTTNSVSHVRSLEVLLVSSLSLLPYISPTIKSSWIYPENNPNLSISLHVHCYCTVLVTCHPG